MGAIAVVGVHAMVHIHVRARSPKGPKGNDRSVAELGLPNWTMTEPGGNRWDDCQMDV